PSSTRRWPSLPKRRRTASARTAQLQGTGRKTADDVTVERADAGQARADHGAGEREVAGLGNRPEACRTRRRDGLFVPGRGARAARAPARRAARGRKSTRLDSSHVKISYAVFCLEEK